MKTKSKSAYCSEISPAFEKQSRGKLWLKIKWLSISDIGKMDAAESAKPVCSPTDSMRSGNAKRDLLESGNPSKAMDLQMQSSTVTDGTGVSTVVANDSSCSIFSSSNGEEAPCQTSQEQSEGKPAQRISLYGKLVEGISFLTQHDPLIFQMTLQNKPGQTTKRKCLDALTLQGKIGPPV